MSATKKEKSLTPKRERFCQEYAMHGNGVKAYRASYNATRMNDNEVSVEVDRLKKNPMITLRLNELKQKDAQKYEAKKEKAISTLMDMLGATPLDCFVENPKSGKLRMRMPDEMSKHTLNSIVEIENDNGKVKYKMYNKIEAIRQLSKLLGWDEAKQIDVKSGGKNVLRIGFNDDE